MEDNPSRSFYNQSRGAEIFGSAILSIQQFSERVLIDGAAKSNQSNQTNVNRSSTYYG
jgi:hypothetical protein